MSLGLEIPNSPIPSGETNSPSMFILYPPSLPQIRILEQFLQGGRPSSNIRVPVLGRGHLVTKRNMCSDVRLVSILE